MTDRADAEFRQVRAGQMRQQACVDVVVDKRPEVGPETELVEPRTDKFHIRTGNWFGHIKFYSKLRARRKTGRVVATGRSPHPSGCYFIIGCRAMTE
jgi:hypothetical protein